MVIQLMKFQKQNQKNLNLQSHLEDDTVNKLKLITTEAT